MDQRRGLRTLAVLFAVAALLAAWVLLERTPGDLPSAPPPPSAHESAPEGGDPKHAGSVPREVESGSTPAPRDERAALAAQLERALQELDPADPEHSREILARLREAFLSADPEVALAVLLAAIERGDDAATGLPFEVALEGLLASAPSLRVALLDWLGQLDPEVAAGVARELLQTRSSPEEWALSLRNLAWGDRGEDSATFLREKTAELVQDTVWAREANSAFLESLDLVAFTTSSDLIYVLEEFVQRSDRPDLRWAAFLATDRMFLTDPVAVMDELMSQPDLFATEPAVRASLLARADPRVPAERRSLEAYLLRDDLSELELSEFAALYPLHAEADGPSLVTRRDGVDIADQLGLDRAAARQLEAWLEDPRFEERRPTLRRIEERLAELDASAKRGEQQRSGTRSAPQ